MKDLIEQRFDGLERVERDLNKLASATEKGLSSVADDIAQEWKQTAPKKTGALSGGISKLRAFILGSDLTLLNLSGGGGQSAMEFVRGGQSAMEFVVSPETVSYEGFVDFDRDGHRGRQSAKRALENLDARDWVDDRMTEQFDKILKK